jgi:hypothetical protein
MKEHDGKIVPCDKLHIFKMDQKGKMMANFVHIGKKTTMIL